MIVSMALAEGVSVPTADARLSVPHCPMRRLPGRQIRSSRRLLSNVVLAIVGQGESLETVTLKYMIRQARTDAEYRATGDLRARTFAVFPDDRSDMARKVINCRSSALRLKVKPSTS